MKPVLPQHINFIIRRLNAAGFSAFAVGGCVRDNLLKKTPHDWDLTTSATPTQVKELFSDLPAIDTGIRYGTVTLFIEGNSVEITTYRRETLYRDSRHPEKVIFSTELREDLARRDFTINAIAYHPEFGLVDPFDGIHDLRKGILRTVGKSEERFQEDGLRILRGLRFLAQLGFMPDPQTAAAIKDCRFYLHKIAAERLETELTKLLLAPYVIPVLENWHSVLGVFLPELEEIVGLTQNNPYHSYDVFTHTLKALEQTPANKIVRYAVLFHDFGKADTKTTDEQGIDHFYHHPAISEQKARVITARLRFSRQERTEVCRLVKYHDVQIPCDSYHVKRWLNRFGEKFFRDLLLVKHADICGQNPALRYRLEQLADYDLILRKIKEEEQCFQRRDLAVNGSDLLAIGYPAGPELGVMLDEMLELVMKQKLPNEKKALLAWASQKRQPNDA